MIIVDFANPDRAAAYLTVDGTEPGFDPVAIARRLREAIPHASRARLFRPGGSIDTDREGAPTPGEVLEDVVNRLLASRRVVRPANDDAAQDPEQPGQAAKASTDAKETPVPTRRSLPDEGAQ